MQVTLPPPPRQPSDADAFDVEFGGERRVHLESISWATLDQLNRFLTVGKADGQSAAVRALREWMKNARR